MHYERKTYMSGRSVRAEHICNLKLILGKKETRRRYAGIAQWLVRQSSKLGMTVRFCLPAQSTLPV